MTNKKFIKSILKIFSLLIIFIGLNVVTSKAAIHSSDPTSTTNSTVSITVTSTEPLQNFDLDVSNKGGLEFVSVSTKGISNGAKVVYASLTEYVTTLATYTFKTPSTPGTYRVTFNVNGMSNTSIVTVTAPANNNSSSVNSTDTQKPTTNSSTTNPSTTAEKSSVATLSNLGIKPNDFSGFKANKYSYNVEVPNEVQSIEVYASKGQSAQTISGIGTKTLKEGINEFNIVVTAEDGKTKKTYTINVTRRQKSETDKPTEEEPQETNEPNEQEEPNQEIFGLSELKIGDLELEPEFHTDIYEYKVQLKEDIEKINVTTVPTETNATTEITGNQKIVEGENIITIVVKSENEEKTATYQVIVNKVIGKIDEQEDTNISEEHKENMKKIIFIVFIIIVAIIMVVAFIGLKKNKKDDEYVEYEHDLNNYQGDEMQEDKLQEKELQKDEKQLYNDKGIEDLEEEQNRKKKRPKGKRFK